MRYYTDFKKNIHPALFGVLISVFLIGLPIFQCSAQPLLIDDKPAMDSMRKAVDLVYNFQFEKAENVVKKMKLKYGNHPSYILFHCISSFYRLFPIGSKPREYSPYIKNLHNLVRISETMSDKSPKNVAELDYYNMTGNLMLARHQSEDGEYIKAVNSTRKAFTFIKRGFEWKTTYPDFYFSTGMYNYFRVAFPENHPFYKSFTIFFPEGNKALGLKDLEIASQKSIFSKAESTVFLSAIYLRDEYNIPMALKFASILHENYPLNWLFSIIYAECLIESKKPDLADPIIEKLLMRTESASLLGGYYLKGLYERQHGNIDAAKWSFQKALNYGKTKDRLTKGYLGLCYNELGKIAHEEGKRNWAKKYFGYALDNCTFKKVKNDAKASGF